MTGRDCDTPYRDQRQSGSERVSAPLRRIWIQETVAAGSERHERPV